MPRLYALGAFELFLGTQLAGARVAGIGWWICVLPACGTVWAATLVLRRAVPESTRLFNLVCALVLGGVAVVLGALIVRTEPAAGYGARVAAFTLGIVVVLNGIRLLVRQWS